MSVLGVLPAAINTSSAVIVLLSPVLLSLIIKFFLCFRLSLLLLSLLLASATSCSPTSLTSLLVIIVICLPSSRSAKADISVSSVRKNCLFLPTIVTFDPMLEKKGHIRRQYILLRQLQCS